MMRKLMVATILAGAMTLVLATAPAVAQTRDGMPLGGRMLVAGGYETGDMDYAPFTVDAFFARAVFASPVGGSHWMDLTGRWGDASEVGSIRGVSAAYSVSIMNGPTAFPGTMVVSLGGEMDRWSLDEGNGSRVALPARFAFGVRLPAGAVEIAPHVGFGVMWQRTSGEAIRPVFNEPGERVSADDSGFRPLGDVGLSLHAWGVMIAAGLSHEFTEHQRLRVSAGFELPRSPAPPLAAPAR